MIGLIIVTHGKFGIELLNSAEMIVGKQENVYAVPFMPGETTETLREKVDEAIENIKDCEEIMFFVDIFGGSPSNCVLPIINENDLECLTGVNLPTLIEALLNRECMNAKELKQMCIQAYNKSMMDLNSLCKRR